MKIEVCRDFRARMRGATLGVFVAALFAVAETSAAFAADAPAAPATSATAALPATPAAAAPLKYAAAPKVICFQSSIRCFSFTPRAASANALPRTTPLDLRAPEINRVFSQEELSKKLQDTEMQYDEVQETVQVQGERQLAPVSIGLMSLPWAVLHPTQAWRILTPVTSAK
jgi:hypothetical protein